MEVREKGGGEGRMGRIIIIKSKLLPLRLIHMGWERGKGTHFICLQGYSQVFENMGQKDLNLKVAIQFHGLKDGIILKGLLS